jgi:hypothetical protein
MKSILAIAVALTAHLAAQQAVPTFAHRGQTQAPPEHHAADLQGLGRGQTKVCFDDRAADGALWAAGTAWKAGFDAKGATVVPFFGSEAPQNYPLRLELDRATVGGEPLVLTANRPTHSDAQVRTDRGSLVEVFDTKLETLEQSFVFDRLPNRGEVAVEVEIATELVASAIPGGLRFANERGHVDYTKAVAVDANGMQLELPIEWTGTAARMVIPSSFVQQAALPLVLDPVLNYWFLVGGAPQQNRESDVASFQDLGGRTLMVWKRTWSAADNDCWGVLFDGNLGLVQTDFVIDLTILQDWRKIAVASNHDARNFLVVSEIREGSVHWIGGCTISAIAAVSPVITIERAGVGGSLGNHYHPDVGGDPFVGSPAGSGPSFYCVVFQKINGTSEDIYMRLVRPDASLAGIATQLSNLSETESRPAISKSCGAYAERWLVTWQRTWPTPPFDQEVWGRFVDWNGAPFLSAFGIAETFAEETAPSPGAAIEVDGVRLWPVAYELASAPGQPRDIVLRILNADGTFRAQTTVNNSAATVDDREPSCDTDYQRLVVGFTSQSPAGNPQATAALLAFLGGPSSTFRVDDYTALTGLPTETNTQVNVCADFGGGYVSTQRYFISYSQENTNTFNLINYGGWVNGSFFTTFPSQCGTLSITPSGSPVLNSSVTMTAGNGAASLIALGFPDSVSLLPLGCNCVLGLNSAVLFNNPLVWNVPNNVAFVGIQLSAQGITVLGNQCLGFLDLSDTIDFIIR